MQRLENIKKRVDAAKVQASMVTQGFVINDRTVYGSPSDFRSAKAREAYNDLLLMRQQSEKGARVLESLRDQYYEASDEPRAQLKPTILKSEQDQEQLNLKIRETEKRIRILENQELKNP